MEATQSVITLKGSAKIVTKFFGYSVNSILYQRGIYPQETFKTITEFGIPLLVTDKKDLEVYLSKLLSDVEEWLEKKTIQKLVLVIRSLEDGEVLERWQFNIECDKNATSTTVKEKSEKDIHKGIQPIIRQITASVTFLPILECRCSFEIITYVDRDQTIPETWHETGAGLIDNSQEVKLKSFDTAIHKVSASVAYKIFDN